MDIYIVRLLDISLAISRINGKKYTLAVANKITIIKVNNKSFIRGLMNEKIRK
tara:strand:- start:2253 stop:2411 length:159 start_codon:yes stop_codon:yes gene_type:complete